MRAALNSGKFVSRDYLGENAQLALAGDPSTHDSTRYLYSDSASPISSGVTCGPNRLTAVPDLSTRNLD